jgi:hypothetical protein
VAPSISITDRGLRIPEIRGSHGKVITGASARECLQLQRNLHKSNLENLQNGKRIQCNAAQHTMQPPVGDFAFFGKSVLERLLTNSGCGMYRTGLSEA